MIAGNVVRVQLFLDSTQTREETLQCFNQRDTFARHKPDRTPRVLHCVECRFIYASIT